MSQTGFTPIQLYRTATASAVPSAANLVVGELAINYTDGKLFYEDNLGAVQTIASKDAAAGNFVNLAYTGTLTGGTGVVNIGSGQIYKDASGNVVLGGTTVLDKLTINTNTNGFAGAYVTGNQGGTAEQMGYRAINANGTGIFLGVNGANYSSGIGNANGAVIQALGAGTSLSVATNGATRFTIDPAGNAGLGVTPSAWEATARVIDIGSLGAVGRDSSGQTFLNFNAYTDVANVRRYKTSTFASIIEQTAGEVRILTAPSGTAGNPITFTQAMTLTQGGNLLVGTTVDNGHKINALENIGIRTENDATGSGALRLAVSTSLPQGSVAVKGTKTAAGTAFMQFDVTAGGVTGEAARITSGGYFKASNTGTYTTSNGIDSVANSLHHFQSSATSSVARFISTSTAAAVEAVLTDLPSSSTGFHFASYLDNNTNVYRVLANGNVQNTNNSYGAISDAKLKENVVDASSYLDRFMQVRFRNFNFIGSDLKQFGVIAQELEQVFPSLVDESPDMEQVTKTRTVEVSTVDEVLDEEGNVVTPAQPATTREEEYTESVPTGTVTKSVKYSVLAQMQGKVIQEQQAIINAQQTKIEELEGTVAQQTTVLTDLLTRVSKLESLQ